MRYRKKPIIIEATAWYKGEAPLESMIEFGQGYYIKTPEGDMLVGSGDYIITDENDEYHLCRANEFDEMYEEE